MKIEQTYSQKDLVNRCYGCRFLQFNDNEWFYGHCLNESSKVKDKERNILSKACVCKRFVGIFTPVSCNK